MKRVLVILLALLLTGDVPKSLVAPRKAAA